MRLRALREAQIDARRLLDATESALAEDGGLLSPTEIEAIRKAIYSVADSLETDAEVEALRLSTSALSAATDAFAARRMNASIQKALAGRAMDSLIP
jgi:molecular chaperone HscA